MRLSEAMNLGCSITKMDDDSWKTCLLGVSVTALNGADNYMNLEAEVRWPWILGEFPCPSWLIYKTPHTAKWILSEAATRVNTQKLSLETVVDWIRSVEPAEPEAVQLLNSEETTAVVAYQHR